MAAAVSADALTVGPDAFGYLATDEVTFGDSWQDITGMEGVARYIGTDDDVWTRVQIDFDFNFYGTDYRYVNWTDNGLITFGFGNHNTQYSNVDLTAQAPNVDAPTIAVLWDDWVGREAGSGVYHLQTGTEPTRRFIIQWETLDGYVPGGGTNSTVTFQATLYEETGEILLLYKDVDAEHLAYDFGIGATVGIRNTGGQTDGRNLQWSYNQAVISGGTAIRITNIPEPVTMAGLMLGIGSLAGYVRRRRMA
jgi:hypothetical protein